MSDVVDIKALRKHLSWTQDQMGDYLGLDRSSISRLEGGQPLKGPAERLVRALVESSGFHSVVLEVAPNHFPETVPPGDAA